LRWRPLDFPVVGMAVVVVGMAAAVGAAADGTEGTTAVAGTGMLDTIAGTADGAGGAVGGTRGGLFRCHSLIHITAGTTDPAMGMDTDQDMGMDTARVTGTGTDVDDPNSIQITITKERSFFVFKLLEASAVVRAYLDVPRSGDERQRVDLRTSARRLWRAKSSLTPHRNTPHDV
jgi:hypothetical protein